MIRIEETRLKEIFEKVIDERLNKFFKKIAGESEDEPIKNEMNMKEVTNYMNVSRATVQNWIKSDRIRSTKRGNMRYFDRKYIETFREAMRNNYVVRLPPKNNYNHPHHHLDRHEY